MPLAKPPWIFNDSVYAARQGHAVISAKALAGHSYGNALDLPLLLGAETLGRDDGQRSIAAYAAHHAGRVRGSSNLRSARQVDQLWAALPDQGHAAGRVVGAVGKAGDDTAQLVRAE